MAPDTRTVLVIMVVSNLLMAAALWIAFAGRFRNGLAQWTTALYFSAACWTLFALQGLVSELFSLVVASVCGGVSLVLEVAALFAFHGRRIPIWIWAQPIAVALMFYLLSDAPIIRAIVGDIIFGSTNLAIGIGVLRLVDATPRARRILAASFLLPGALLLTHGVALMTSADVSVASPMQWSLFLIVYATTLLSSFAFLIMQQEHASAEAQRLATIDSLTGVFNRRTFFELAEREFARAQRSSVPVSLLLLDLDHFKQINDTHGHLAGDRVLVAFAHLLQECVRQEDLLMRYGGEEFGILLYNVDDAAARQLAERIRAQTEQAPIIINGGTIMLTVSIGIATRRNSDTTSIDLLLARADEALYLAKRRGRNCVVTHAIASNDLPPQQHQSPQSTLLHQPAA